MPECGSSWTTQRTHRRKDDWAARRRSVVGGRWRVDHGWWCAGCGGLLRTEEAFVLRLRRAREWVDEESVMSERKNIEVRGKPLDAAHF